MVFVRVLGWVSGWDCQDLICSLPQVPQPIPDSGIGCGFLLDAIFVGGGGRFVIDIGLKIW